MAPNQRTEWRERIGLGELIFRGVASIDNRLVLAGAVPAALLALIADAVLGILERWFKVPAQ